MSTLVLPRLILCDLDGTLVDSIPDLAYASQCMAGDLDLPVPTLEQIRCWVGNGMERLVKRVLTNDMHAEPDAQLLQEAIKLFKHHYTLCNGQHSVVYEGVYEGLQWLSTQGVELACVTNKPEDFTHPLLDALALEKYFTLIVGGDTLNTKKPDPQPLLHCMKHFNKKANETLMLGDSKNDVNAARAAKIPVVCVSYGYNHGESIALSQPDAIIDSMTELTSIFNKTQHYTMA